MKKKFALVLLSAALGVCSFNGCGGADKETKTSMAQEPKNENTLRGEVSKVTEDTITIKVETRKEKPEDGEKAEGSAGEAPKGQRSGMEGSSEEITISDISQGDVIMITLANDKSAAEITVMAGMPDGGDNMPPADERSDENDGMV